MDETLENLLKHRTRYELMLETLQRHHDVFDQEDTKLVELRLSDIDTAIEEVRDKIQKREFILENTVKKLQHVLETRQRVLEDVDAKTGLFELDKELLDHLAMRQKDMQQKLDLLLAKADEL